MTGEEVFIGVVPPLAPPAVPVELSSGSSGRILSLDDCFVDRVLRYMLTTERGARVMVNATLIGWVMVGTSGDNTRQVDEYPDSVS